VRWKIIGFLTQAILFFTQPSNPRTHLKADPNISHKLIDFGERFRQG
jgi:hypothetical protein